MAFPAGNIVSQIVEHKGKKVELESFAMVSRDRENGYTCGRPTQQAMNGQNTHLERLAFCSRVGMRPCKNPGIKKSFETV